MIQVINITKWVTISVLLKIVVYDPSDKNKKVGYYQYFTHKSGGGEGGEEETIKIIILKIKRIKDKYILIYL